jgi:zinc transport system permease protein
MLDLTFMQLALLASLTTGASLGLVGVYLVMRRVVFLGLVLANAATLGAALAEGVGAPHQVVAPLVAVGAAVALGRMQTPGRVSAESVMGWAYAAVTAATALVLSVAAIGSTDAVHLFFGNILAVHAQEVIVLGAMTAVVGLAHLLFGRRFLLVTFDAEGATVAGVATGRWSMALTLMIGVITAAAVHSIGALSTFSLLTLPALTALLATRSVRATFAVATAVGAAVPSVALLLSFYLDLPAGPTAVALLALGVPCAFICRQAIANRRRSMRALHEPRGVLAKLS